MNVALYRAGHDRWAMTERGRSSLTRDANSLTIAASAMHWDGAALGIEINEWTAPVPSRMRGAVTVRPEFVADKAYALDSTQRHFWKPIAPRAQITASFDDGALSWRGDGYFDCNWGDEPLEDAFGAWTWSRAHTRDGAIIHYDVAPRVESDRSLALRFDRSGAVASFEPPPTTPLPETFWRVPRTVRGAPHMLRTLEDAPFYARTALTGEIDGEPADIMHESLSLDRLRTPWVRAMLPFRMPRLAGRR